MATLLGIDTATSMGTVAVGDGERVLVEVTLGVGTRHSDALLPAIRFALEQARLEPSLLDGVVVGAGPGSFTGVRIAAATAKALAHAAKLPLYAYSTLLALAASAVASGFASPAAEGLVSPAGEGLASPAEEGLVSPAEEGRGDGGRKVVSGSIAGARPVCAVLDARRGEVYAACYRFGAASPPDTLMTPTALTIDELVRRVAPLEPVFVGDGARRHHGMLAGSAIAPPHVGLPRASALLWLAAVQPDAGYVVTPARWEPEYVRASGAERGIRG